MKDKSQTVSEYDLMHEISELLRQLDEARLKIEGYEIMGDVLKEQYGVDLLKNPQPSNHPTQRTTH
jgi:hypothetical protein